MVEAAANCKVSVVTKRQKLSTGETHFITSIWALSDDRTVRLQQERKHSYSHSFPPPKIPSPLTAPITQSPTTNKSSPTLFGTKPPKSFFASPPT